MLLAKNNTFSLHMIEPNTYSHATVILVERVKLYGVEYRATHLVNATLNQSGLSKLSESITAGAGTNGVELYPLHFVCGGHPTIIGQCPANERVMALQELEGACQ